MTKTKVLGYSRVSTLKQDLSPEVQHKMARDWYELQVSQNAWPDGSVFLDMLFDQISSKVNLLERPKGQLIPTILDRGDVLVVSRSDRAFRSAADCEIALTQLQEAGIRVVFLNLPVDTGTAEGMLMASIMAAVSRYEREAIRWRTKAALQRRREMGLCTGHAPAGYMYYGEKKPGKRRKVGPDNRYRRIAEFLALQFHELREMEKVADLTWKYFKKWKKPSPMRADDCEAMISRFLFRFPFQTHEEFHRAHPPGTLKRTILLKMCDDRFSPPGISYVDPK
jgi:DNA invertase Pin-like site-specific DNA recombinase